MKHFLILAWIFAAGAITLQAQSNANPTPAAAPSSPAMGTVPPDMTAAQQMPEGPDRKKAIAAAGQAWAKSDPVGFFTWLLALDAKHSGEVWPIVASAGESADPKAAADFLAQHVSDSNMQLVHGFTIGWARKDPAAAEAWSIEPQLPENVRYLAIYTVADALCRKDPKLAVAWTATVTGPEDHLAAIDGTITIWGRGDPVAATVWIKQMNPQEMKRAAQSMGNSWGMTKGKIGPTLESWVDQLPLSDADKQDVLKGPRLDSSHISKYNAAVAAANSPAKS